MVTRRTFLSGSAAAGATAYLAAHGRAQPRQAPPAQAVGGRPGSVITPNGASLPPRDVSGVKVFHLVAEEVDVEMTPGMTLRLWGYNGMSPGPTIEATEGDRVRIYVTNRLPEPTTVHWHGILLPSGMDGVGGLNQPHIAPGETYRYEFELLASGTFMYHPHYDEMTQMGLGMMGMIVVHPRTPRGPQPDRDFAIILNEWHVEPGTSRPNTARMDFNMLTMNHRAFPSTDALVARVGDRVRMRFGNLSPIDNHPIHLHGYNFEIIGTDGGWIAPSARWPETTVLVPIGSTRTIEFVARYPGDWAMHCHMTHHVMNQMGHDIPNMIGADVRGLGQRVRRAVPGFMPMGQNGMGGMGEMAERMPIPTNTAPMRGGAGPHGYIDMGGMFTILKVREGGSYDDAGWYRAPAGTQARTATEAELSADGIDV